MDLVSVIRGCKKSKSETKLSLSDRLNFSRKSKSNSLRDKVNICTILPSRPVSSVPSENELRIIENVEEDLVSNGTKELNFLKQNFKIINNGPTISSDGQKLSYLMENEASSGTCPSCHFPYDKGKRRMLLDSCGHQRCYLCIFKNDNCPVCSNTGLSPTDDKAMMSSSEIDLDPERQMFSTQHPLNCQPQILAQQARIDTSCLYGNVPSNVQNRGRSMTPTIEKKSPPISFNPSVTPRTRRNWIQKYNRRPNTVNIDENTMSDDASSTSSRNCPPSIHINNHRASVSSHPSRSESAKPCSEGQESGFLSSASITSLSSSTQDFALQDNPIIVLGSSTGDSEGSKDLPVRKTSCDSMASLTSQKSSIQVPSIGGRRYSLTRIKDREEAGSRISEVRRSTHHIPFKKSRDLCNSQVLFTQYRPIQWFLKPLFFEVPQRDLNTIFVSRQWLYKEISDHLLTHKGIVINGAPGSGKTTLILQLVEQSCFGSTLSREKENYSSSASLIKKSNNYLQNVALSVVAYHFCQSDSSMTCTVPEWVHSLAAQLAQAPCLAAYHNLLSTDQELRTILSMSSCTANPDTAFVKGILQPLSDLSKHIKDPCILLLDALYDGQIHRPDYGDTIATFIEKHLDQFPSWLKIVCTQRNDKNEITRDFPFHKIRLDTCETAENVNKDISEYVYKRMSKSDSILTNITPTVIRSKEENKDSNPAQRFQRHLVDIANGCFLYVKLTLDLIEKGHLIMKSSSFKVLPQTISEVFLLEFNLKFPSTQSFKKVSDILSICLAAIQPLTLSEINSRLNALCLVPKITWQDFIGLFHTLSSYLVVRKDESVMFFHPLFREWLIRRSEIDPNKFLCDPRIGHTAAAISMCREQTPIECDKTLELGHHLLKAHIYKNATNALPSRDLLASWISQCADDVSAALGFYQNIYSPNINVSRLLLLSGASPDIKTNLLHSAPLICLFAQQGYTAMISLLLEFGADINATNSQGFSALTFAALGGKLDSVKVLLENGAKVNQKDYSESCPLVHAARNGHLSTVEFLTSCDWISLFDKDLNLEEACQQAAIASSYAGNLEILDFLLDMSEVKVDQPDTLMGETSLSAAAAGGRIHCCETLLRRGATITTTNLKNCTPIYLAAKEGHWTICELLIKEKAQIDQPDKDNRTPLMAAAMEGHLGVVDLLVSKEANINQMDKDGITPLMWACAKGKAEIAKLFLQHGVDINHADKTGRTALDLAAFSGDGEVVNILIDNGAMMEHVDINGLRPLDRAISHKNIEVVRCFLKKGAKLGPSTWAMANGKLDIMLILLNKLLEDGNTLFKKQKLQEASQRYSYAIKRIPSDNKGIQKTTFEQLKIHLLLNLCRCKRKQGSHKEAIEIATAVIEILPVSYEAYHARAKAHHDAGNLQQALVDMTEAVKKAPSKRELHKILLNLREEINSKSKVSNKPPSDTLNEEGCVSGFEGKKPTNL